MLDCSSGIPFVIGAASDIFCASKNRCLWRQVCRFLFFFSPEAACKGGWVALPMGIKSATREYMGRMER